MGDEAPGFGAVDGFLPISCQTATATKPREGALDEAATGQYLEALCSVGSIDDLQIPAPEADKGAAQLWSGIAAISEHVAQPRGLATQFGKDPGRTFTFLNIGASRRCNILDGVPDPSQINRSRSTKAIGAW